MNYGVNSGNKGLLELDEQERKKTIVSKEYCRQPLCIASVINNWALGAIQVKATRERWWMQRQGTPRSLLFVFADAFIMTIKSIRHRLDRLRREMGPSEKPRVIIVGRDRRALVGDKILTEEQIKELFPNATIVVDRWLWRMAKWEQEREAGNLEITENWEK